MTRVRTKKFLGFPDDTIEWINWIKAFQALEIIWKALDDPSRMGESVLFSNGLLQMKYPVFY